MLLFRVLLNLVFGLVGEYVGLDLNLLGEVTRVDRILQDMKVIDKFQTYFFRVHIKCSRSEIASCKDYAEDTLVTTAALLQFLRIYGKGEADIVSRKPVAILAIIAAGESTTSIALGPADCRNLCGFFLCMSGRDEG